MRRKLNDRLRSQGGETIAEVLISLLIAVLALMMLAMMISSTVSMVTRSKDRMDEYYSENEELELQNNPSSDEPITITIKTAASSTITVEETPNVVLYENTAFNKSVYAYRIVKEDNNGGNSND